MTGNSAIDEIIELATQDFRKRLQDVVESIRAKDRSEMERRLMAAFSAEPQRSDTPHHGHPHERGIVQTTRGDRVAPGTVKPTIMRLIEESSGLGISTNEIINKTGFKENSVRATLTTLGNDGFAERRGDRWIKRDEAPSNKSEEAP